MALRPVSVFVYMCHVDQDGNFQFERDDPHTCQRPAYYANHLYPSDDNPQYVSGQVSYVCRRCLDLHYRDSLITKWWSVDFVLRLWQPQWITPEQHLAVEMLCHSLSRL